VFGSFPSLSISWNSLRRVGIVLLFFLKKVGKVLKISFLNPGSQEQYKISTILKFIAKRPKVQKKICICQTYK
jgi:hypothetical protein